MIVHHPRLFRRTAWEEVGGFDEDLTNAVDYDFFLKLSEVGGMAHISKKLYSYRIHQLSTSQEKRGLQTDNTLLVQQKALERMNLDNFVNYAPNPDFPRRIQYRFEAFSNMP
jgi:GT2 family glycosyltransferase